MSGKVSLRPDSFTETEGFIDDFDGFISDGRFIMTDYGGAAQEAIPAANVSFTIEEGSEFSKLYSVGGKGDFVPDDTGKCLVPLKSRETLSKPKKGSGQNPSKFVMFMDSLVEAGFPQNRIGDDISCIVGLNGHFLTSVVEYSGLKKKDDRESTVLLCTKINQLPGDSEKVAGKKKGKGKATAPSVETATAVIDAIQSILIENGGEMAKKDLLSALFKSEAVKASSDKKGALKLASNDTWLNERDEWNYEDGVLKMVFE